MYIYDIVLNLNHLSGAALRRARAIYALAWPHNRVLLPAFVSQLTSRLVFHI